MVRHTSLSDLQVSAEFHQVATYMFSDLQQSLGFQSVTSCRLKFFSEKVTCEPTYKKATSTVLFIELRLFLQIHYTTRMRSSTQRWNFIVQRPA